MTDGIVSPAYGCFSLQQDGGLSKERNAEISICFNSNNRYRVNFIYQFGHDRKHRFQKKVRLDFDATIEIGMYAIYWHPEFITFYVNDEEIVTIPGSPRPAQMRMKVTLLPLPSDQGFAKDSVEMAMLIHRVHYRSSQRLLEKEELLVKGNRNRKVPRFVIIIIIFTGIYLWKIICERIMEIRSPKYEMLLQSDAID